MKNDYWKRMTQKSTQILGNIWAPCLMGAMFGTFTALCITLPISRTNDNTLGESIFGKNESLDVQIKLLSGEELRLRATGATTMEVVQSLKKMLPDSERNPLEGLY
tara:strand:+ start:2497 stop:2814 length:318 start_codon:yes stop_codon:yes gene_type:complete